MTLTVWFPSLLECYFLQLMMNVHTQFKICMTHIIFLIVGYILKHYVSFVHLSTSAYTEVSRCTVLYTIYTRLSSYG